MKILLTGLSHHTAPLDIRERMVFDAAALPLGLKRLAERVPGAEECLILSTCNRTEILLRRDDLSPAPAQVRGFLSEKSGIDDGRLDRALYAMRDEEAVRHFFRVAASLDSMIVGEPQILKQVKDAHACALGEGRLGTILDHLCRRAFHAAKRVRTETEIGRNPVSISYAAAELARTIFGELSGRSVLVLGAGKMSELTLRHLVAGGAGTIYVTTRHMERAVDVARRVGGEPIPFDRMLEPLDRVDIVISSTAAPHLLLRRDQVADLMRQRRNRPMFFIDIAVPRDIDPAVNELDNVYLYDIDDLQRVVSDNVEGRQREAAHAERIIDTEVESFRRWYLGLAAGPAITALRQRLHGLREQELERHRGRLSGLTPEQMAAVETYARGLINKILHRPTLELKRSLDGRGAPGRVALVRRLFDLDGEDGPAQGQAAVEGAGSERVPTRARGEGKAS